MSESGTRLYIDATWWRATATDSAPTSHGPHFTWAFGGIIGVIPSRPASYCNMAEERRHRASNATRVGLGWPRLEVEASDQAPNIYLMSTWIRSRERRKLVQSILSRSGPASPHAISICLHRVGRSRSSPVSPQTVTWPIQAAPQSRTRLRNPVRGQTWRHRHARHVAPGRCETRISIDTADLDAARASATSKSHLVRSSCTGIPINTDKHPGLLCRRVGVECRYRDPSPIK